MRKSAVLIYLQFLLCLLLAGIVDVAIAKSGIVQNSARARKEKQTSKPRKVSGEKTRKPQVPLAVFADVEEGWRMRKVENILKHFGKGKVSISMGGAGPSGGYFSRNQSFYLFRDLFKYTITRKFEFTQYRNIHNGGRKVYAVAERRYQRRDDGRIFKDKIYVSLRRENDRWVISEIKSIH